MTELKQPIMQRILFFPVLLSLPLCSSAQTLWTDGATLNIGAGTVLYIQGDLTNAAGSTINNSGELRVTGNLLNNGTTNSIAGSNLILNGTTAQTLGGSSPVSAGDVNVNNAAGITLNAPFIVDGNIAFNAGIINTTTYAVTFTANAAVANTPSDASHINGLVTKQGTGIFTYPTGDAARYQPVRVNLAANSAGLSARYYPADAGAAAFGTGGTSSVPLKFYNQQEYWDLAPTGTATGSVTIFWDGNNNSGIGNIADLRVAHKSGAWQNEGAASVSGNTIAGSVTSNSLSSWSPFTLGSVSTSSPLPVRISSLRAQAAGPLNRIEWRAASKSADMVCIVERSRDGREFQPLTSLHATGLSELYVYEDIHPEAPLSYYRIRQRTPGDDESYSEIVSVRRAASPGAITLAPVPSSTSLTISSSREALTGTMARVTDVTGRCVLTFTLSPLQTLDLSKWASGLYTVLFQDGSIARFVKQ